MADERDSHEHILPFESGYLRITTREDGSIDRIERLADDLTTVSHHDGPAVHHYFPHGNPRQVDFMRNGELHNEDGPARIEYYEVGAKSLEQWWRDGKPHRIDGPAVRVWDKYGNLVSERFATEARGDVTEAMWKEIEDGTYPRSFDLWEARHAELFARSYG